MKNKNIKISRNFILIFGFVIFAFSPFQFTQADLDKDFRENFLEITHQSCFNSINYTVDDITGFELVETGKNEYKSWQQQCQGGKCAEYKKTINCLFDDAFENSVNKTNTETKNYTDEKLPELRDTEIVEKKECSNSTLESIQEKQESLGFETSCEGAFINKSYSACRVTETVFNELCGYEYFLTAKTNDYKSFFNENSANYNYRFDYPTLFKEKSKTYKEELEKAEKSFIETSLLYKNFIHNYRTHTWLVAIKDKLKYAQKIWKKIHKAIETFPAKFIDASSTGG